MRSKPSWRVPRKPVQRAGYRYLFPAGILVGALTLFPLAWLLVLSAQRHSLLGEPVRFIGLGNFVRMAADARFWNALGNTLYFTAVSVALELVLGLAIALAVQRQHRGRPLLYALILLPWAVPTTASARMWEWLYDPDVGLLNYLLGTRVNWLGSPGWALHAAIAMDVWKSTPFVTLLLIAGLQAIPRDVYRAAAVDGASAWLVLRRITLPLLVPVILVALVFRTIDALRVFDAVYVLTGGGPGNSTETLSIYAYKILFQSLELGYGSALALVMFLCSAAVTLLYARLLRRAAG